MSSECLAEDAALQLQQLKETEEEGTLVPCSDSQSAGRLKQEEPVEHRPSSPHCSSRVEVTAEAGLKQAQREETQTQEEEKTLSCLSTKQESQHGESVSGPRMVKRHLRRSKLRGKSSCRCHDEPRGPGPFYYFGGTNGAEIVSKYCDARGWKRIYNHHREDFKLKWCETKSPANYSNFREGEQLMYQIPNNKVLTTKIGLLSSLREFQRVTSKVKHGQGLRRLKMEEFIPTTFRLDLREERETFFSQQEGVGNNERRMWICKPTGLNQGRGIFLLRSQEDVAALRLKLQLVEGQRGNGRVQHRQTQAHIVQHYIQNPLLLKGKKFDVRSYLLIACTSPYMVFFRHGYVRLTCDLYDPSSKNLSAHLTNQYMQKKNPLYSQLKEDTVWSMESFNAYVNDKFQVARGLPGDWVLDAFTRRMQQIMTQCFLAVKPKLDNRVGFFDLFGCDFMVDEDFNVWLLEVNCNPALHTNCEVLKEVIPSTIEETLDLTLEIFNKSRLRQKILPLASQREFVLLYNGVLTTESVPSCSRSNANPRSFHKVPQRTPNTEPRRCKSAAEDKSLASASADHNSGDRKCNSKSVDCSVGSTSPRHENVSSIPEYSGSTSNSSETLRGKNIRPRLQLKLSICTLQPQLQAADDVKHPNILMSLSSPALSQQRCGSPESPSTAEELKGNTESSLDKRKEEP